MTLKVLILGANGFIGASLIPVILKNTPWEIYGMDLAKNRLTDSLNNKRFTFIEGDIRVNTKWINHHVEKCDVILPLAAIANPAIYVTDPLQVFELDFLANLEILHQAVRFNKRIIFPSTSEVYGMSTDQEFNEETSPLVQGPINKERWIYSCSKQLLDRVIYAHGKRDNLPFTLFRPFNWIGPLQDNPHDPNSNVARVVTQFVSNIIYGKDLKLVDGGAQRRCFTYIDDGIDALLEIIENKNSCASGRIFNIGHPKNNYSIRELAEKILALAKNYPKYSASTKKIKIIDVTSGKYYGPGYEDLQNRVPSIANAKKYLDWQPKVDFDAALKAILDYHLTK